ncbi:hypothetical protein [Candidatus Nitrosocosmicus arcticus]|uniref:hypothetical protein n=1 Tax=Candidatus Nitrosocosmicus arcticus TaxID=2035267 RepID=UPI00119D7317|nr:hypothetical protein [Candidatus Nitrosocosmicus arcticus]
MELPGKSDGFGSLPVTDIVYSDGSGKLAEASANAQTAVSLGFPLFESHATSLKTVRLPGTSGGGGIGVSSLLLAITLLFYSFSLIQVIAAPTQLKRPFVSILPVLTSLDNKPKLNALAFGVVVIPIADISNVAMIGITIRCFVDFFNVSLLTLYIINSY